MYNRNNAIPNQAIELRTQFTKFGAPFDPFSASKVFITLKNPLDLSYDENTDLLEEIPFANISKVGPGLFQYTTSSSTIQAIGTFYDSIEFQLEMDGPKYLLVNQFQVTENGLPKLGYVTVQEVRDEGLEDETKYSDAFINSRIAFNTRMIELWTGNFFEAKPLIFDIDGQGAYNLSLDVPIVNIKEVTLLDREFPVTEVFTFELDDIVVYNRHISQGLTQPDDREDPRIGNVYFPKGRQNIRVNGTFGYTDRSGQTPPEIKRALILMVLRDKEKLNSNKRNRSLLSGLGGRIKKETTDGHSYELAIANRAVASTPYFTGDEEIDHLLHSFVRPMALGRGLGANVSNALDQGFDGQKNGFDHFFGRSI